MLSPAEFSYVFFSNLSAGASTNCGRRTSMRGDRAGITGIIAISATARCRAIDTISEAETRRNGNDIKGK